MITYGPGPGEGAYEQDPVGHWVYFGPGWGWGFQSELPGTDVDSEHVHGLSGKCDWCFTQRSYRQWTFKSGPEVGTKSLDTS